MTGEQYNAAPNLCNYFLNGGCTMGRSCRFYHDFSRLKRSNPSSSRTARPYPAFEFYCPTETGFADNRPTKTQSEIRWCTNCNLHKQRSCFSKTQARRPSNKRKCMDCTTRPNPPSSKKLKTRAQAASLEVKKLKKLKNKISAYDNKIIANNLLAAEMATMLSEVAAVTGRTATPTDTPTVMSTATPAATPTGAEDGGLGDDTSDIDEDKEPVEDPSHVIIETNDHVEIHTTREILRNSRYFEALLSQRWGGEGLRRIQVDRSSCIVEYLLKLMSSDISAVDVPEYYEEQVLSDCEYYQIDPAAKDISEMEMSKPGNYMTGQDATDAVHNYEKKLADDMDNMSDSQIKRAAVKLIKKFDVLIEDECKRGKSSATVFIGISLGEPYERVEHRLSPYVKTEMERRGYRVSVDPEYAVYDVYW